MLYKAVKAVLISLCLFACNCAHVGNFLPTDMVSQLHNANVVVGTEDSFCSGVIVGEHKVLTAAHCVHQCKDKAVIIGTNGGKTIGAPIKCDLENDLAVVLVEEKLMGARPVASAELVVGDPIYVVGNPVLAGGPLFDFTTFGIVANKRGTSLLLTSVSRGGASGGAVYNLRGQVAGILVGTPLGADMMPITGLSVAVTLKPILAILE